LLVWVVQNLLGDWLHPDWAYGLPQSAALLVLMLSGNFMAFLGIQR
jgi:hypothetical protein